MRDLYIAFMRQIFKALGMACVGWWCRGRPLPAALSEDWTRGAARRHTTAPINRNTRVAADRHRMSHVWLYVGH